MKPTYCDLCLIAAHAASYAFDAACKMYEHAHKHGSAAELDAACAARDAAERAFWRAVEARDALPA